jgi:hypothetical protein
MTPEELLEHEEAIYRHIATCTLLGSWGAKLSGKRLTVIVYGIKFNKKADMSYHTIKSRRRKRLAVSFGMRMLTSLELES